MAKWTDKGGGFKNPAPGTYEAVCTRIIDIGTQPSSYKGKENLRRKVILFWELAQYMEDGRPFITQCRYTASLSAKSTLRAHLETWRGKAFTDEQIEAFEQRKLLGQGCQITLVQDGDYVNVAAVTSLPVDKTTGKKVAAMVPSASTVYFDLDEFDQAVFDGLSENMQAKIMDSPEYKKLKGIKTGTDEGMGEGPGPQSDPADDIPF